MDIPRPASVFCGMASASLQSRTSAGPLRGVTRYTGRVIYLYAFDVAYDMLREPVPQLLGQTVAEFSVDGANANRAISFSPARKWSACRRWSGSGPAARCGWNGR